jgi:hypothetical protein
MVVYSERKRTLHFDMISGKNLLTRRKHVACLLSILSAFQKKQRPENPVHELPLGTRQKDILVKDNKNLRQITLSLPPMSQSFP